MTLTRDQAIQENMFTVKYVINSLRLNVKNKVDLEDIEGVGTVGLLRAYDDFDPEKNASFRTYAIYKIRGYILDYLRSTDHVSRNDRKKLKAIYKSEITLTQKLNRFASDVEVIEDLNMEFNEFYRLKNLRSKSSLDITLQVDDQTACLSETLEDQNINSPFDILDKKDKLNLVKKIMQSLPEKEKIVISMYYFDELNLKQIGIELNLSESRISRLLKSALDFCKANI